MPYINDSYINDLTEQGPSKFEEASNLADNFSHAWNTHGNERSILSPYFNQELEMKRRDQINQAIIAGDIPEDILDNYMSDGRVSYGGLADYLQETTGNYLLTDEKITELRGKDIREQRNIAEDIFARQTYGGWMAQMGGIFLRELVEPQNLALAVPGLGTVAAGARGASLLTKLGTAAAYEATIEAIRVPVVVNHSRKIGVDYTIQDGLMDIGIAMTAAGVITTGAHLLTKTPKFAAKKYNTIREKVRKHPDSSQADRDLDNLQFEADNTLNPTGKYSDEMEMVATEEARQNNLPNEANLKEIPEEDAIIARAVESENIGIKAKEGEEVLPQGEIGKAKAELDDYNAQLERALGCIS